MAIRLLAGFLFCASVLFGRADGVVFSKGTNLESLVVVDRSALGGAAMQTLMATLQGLVARRSTEQIYFDDCCGYDLWLDHLRDHYGIPIVQLSDPWIVLSRFRNLVDGYVLYDRSNPDSVNAATSLCGPFGAIAVDRSLENQVHGVGIVNRMVDVSSRDEAWTWTNYADRFSRRVVVEQDEGKYFHLRDYAVMTDAFTFSDGVSSFRTSVMSAMSPDASVLGWGAGGEDGFVGDSSRRGAAAIPSDWAVNLSTLSSVRDDSIYQSTYSNPTAESGVHYVTFIVTDGDNVQWNLGGFPGYFNHPARGEFDMGWALSPSLADLAPSVLRWYYANASNSPARDFFVVGPSGNGYLYPSLYPPDELDLHVTRLNALMGAADLSIVQIIDFNSFGRTDLWNKYTAQFDISALVYLEFAPYNGARGAIVWSNGKPVIGAREMLWDGLGGADEASVIDHINNAPRDPLSADGYSLVAVHVWSKDLGDVKQVVDNLAPDVRVVTPDRFVKLIQANIGNRMSFNFTGGLQDWSGGTTGKPYDAARWTSSEGGGALHFDGSDLGNRDPDPNSWFTRQLNLPTNAVSLRFQTRAVNDGELRVRLRRPDSSFVTLLDWESLPDPNWVTRTLDMTPYAGRTVTIYFEQNDGGQGSGEHRFVDNVAVVVNGVPTSLLPATPKLLEVMATPELEIELLWRDNGNLEAGFRVERKEGPDGEWSEVGSVPADVTRYTDREVMPGKLYFYRVRSWSSRGTSAYSGERSAATAPAPSVSIRRFGAGYLVRWPALPGFVPESASSPFGSWAAASETVIAGAETNGIRISVGTGSRFFRLVRVP